MSSRRGGRSRRTSKQLYSNRKKIDPVDYLEIIDGGDGKQSEISMEALHKINYDDLFPENEADMDGELIYEIKRDCIEKNLSKPNMSATRRKKLDREYSLLNSSKKATLSEREFHNYHSEQKQKVDRVKKDFDEAGFKEMVQAKRAVYQKSVVK